MTYTEQYNEYVQEWIKDNSSLSGPYYEPMLDFDEWVDKKLEEYKNIMEASESDKSFLEIDYTKESILSKKYYVLTEDVPCWHWSRNEDDTLDWNIMGYNSKEVSPRKVIPEEYIKKIADDYAIEFLIWASQFALQRFDEDRWQVLGLKDFGFTKTVSTKEILEEFKKEKGL